MLAWYVSFADGPPTWDEVETEGNPTAERLKQEFREGAKTGTCRGRPVRWMLMVDRASSQNRVVFVYGEAPFHKLPDGPSHLIDATTVCFSAVTG